MYLSLLGVRTSSSRGVDWLVFRSYPGCITHPTVDVVVSSRAKITNIGMNPPSKTCVIDRQAYARSPPQGHHISTNQTFSPFLHREPGKRQFLLSGTSYLRVYFSHPLRLLACHMACDILQGLSSSPSLPKGELQEIIKNQDSFSFLE